jgi:hypothetical protein
MYFCLCGDGTNKKVSIMKSLHNTSDIVEKQSGSKPPNANMKAKLRPQSH